MAATPKFIILTDTQGNPNRVNVALIATYFPAHDGTHLCLSGLEGGETFCETPEQIDALVGGDRERQLAEALQDLADASDARAGSEAALDKLKDRFPDETADIIKASDIAADCIVAEALAVKAARALLAPTAALRAARGEG